MTPPTTSRCSSARLRLRGCFRSCGIFLCGGRELSLRVVENDAQRMPMSRSDAADAVAEIHSIHAPLTLHGSIMDCEHNAVPLSKRHNHRPRLHARALLCHHELAAREFIVGFR